MTSEAIQKEALKVDIMTGVHRVKILYERFKDLWGVWFYCENCEKRIEWVHLCRWKSNRWLLNADILRDNKI